MTKNLLRDAIFTVILASIATTACSTADEERIADGGSDKDASDPAGTSCGSPADCLGDDVCCGFSEPRCSPRTSCSFGVMCSNDTDCTNIREPFCLPVQGATDSATYCQAKSTPLPIDMTARCSVTVALTGAVQMSFSSDGCGGIGWHKDTFDVSYGYAVDSNFLRLRFAATKKGMAAEDVEVRVEFEQRPRSWTGTCSGMIEPFKTMPDPRPIVPGATMLVVSGKVVCSQPLKASDGSTVSVAPFSFVATKSPARWP